MGLLRPPRFGLLSRVIFSISLFMAMVPRGSSDVFVKFTKTPPAVSGNTTAAFSFKAYVDASGDNPCSYDSFSCKLDDGISANCEERRASYFGLMEGNHTFEVCTNGSQGVDCASYDWTIDTTPPAVSVTASESFTSALNVSVVVTFSEPCPGGGGFRCASVDDCNLLVYGPGQVIPSSLKVLEPNLKYSLLVNISSGVQYGRLILVADKNFCTDSAGNVLTTTQNSSFFVHFDRRSVSVDVRTEIPKQLLPLDGDDRTVQCTNNHDRLKVIIYFSEPVLNSSVEILQSLKPSQGVLHPENCSTLGNRRFCYTVTSLSTTAVVTVRLESDKLISRGGTPTVNIEPVTFLYDTQRPEVSLSTTSTFRTTNPNIPIFVNFVKPMAAGFNSSHVVVQGGHLQSFQEISRSRYAVEIRAASDVISVSIPENVTQDVAGNRNLPSNVLQVKHYSEPIVSRVVSTFATVTVLATASASGLLTVSTAGLQAAGASAGPISQPSSNLCRMVSHVQVFALSRWLGVVLPVEYYELSRSLEWTIPYMTLPWEAKKPQPAMVPPPSSKLRTPIADSRINEAILHPGPPTGRGSPLSRGEYQSLFEISNSTKPEAGYTRDRRFRSGWIDFERNMFWLAVIGGSLILLHLLLLLILKLKKRTPNNNNNNNNNNYGALTFPRFELFLLVLAKPCISQASAALVRGRTSSGVTLGIFLLVFVALCLLGWLLFVSGGIIFRKLLRYEEVPQQGQRSQWYGELTRAALGPGRRGRWTWKSNPNSTSLIMAGPLFEDLRGPPKNTPSQIPEEGLQKGERVIESEEGNEDAEATSTEKLFGTLGIYYPLLECAKRVCIGVMAGASMGKKPRKTPSMTLLCITSFQLLFIVLTKPFINKNVQLVEIISTASEVGLFALCVFLPEKQSPKEDESSIGIVMVVLFLLGFIPQTLNQWFSQRSQVRQLGRQDKSFFSGLKVASRGLLVGVQPTSMAPELESKLSSKQREGEEETEEEVGAKGCQGRGNQREEDENIGEEERMEEARGEVHGGMGLEEGEEAGRVHGEGEESRGGDEATGRLEGEEKAGGEGEEAKSELEREEKIQRVIKGGEDAREEEEEEEEESGGGDGRKVVEAVGREEGVTRGLEGGESTQVGAQRQRGRRGRKRGNNQRRVEQERRLMGIGGQETERRLSGENETRGGIEQGEEVGEGGQGQRGLEGGEELTGGGEEVDKALERVDEVGGGEDLIGGDHELIGEDEAEDGLGEEDELETVLEGGEETQREEDVVGHCEEVRKGLGGGEEVGSVFKERREAEKAEPTMLGVRRRQGRGGRKRGTGQRRSGQERRLEERGGEETERSLKVEDEDRSRLEEGDEVGTVLEGGKEETEMVFEGIEEFEEGKELEGGEESERVLEVVEEVEEGEEAETTVEGAKEARGGGEEAERVVKGCVIKDEEGKELEGRFDDEGGQEAVRIPKGGVGEEARRMVLGGDEARMMLRRGGGLRGKGREDSRGRAVARAELAGGKDAIWMLGREAEGRGGEGADMLLKGGDGIGVLLQGDDDGGVDVIGRVFGGGEGNEKESRERDEIKGRGSTRVRGRGRGGQTRANEERKRGNEIGRVPRGGNERRREVGGGEDTTSGRGLEGGAEAAGGGLGGEDMVEVVGEGEAGVGVDEGGMMLGVENVELGDGAKEGEEVGVVLGGDEVGEGEDVGVVLGGEEAERGLGGDEEKVVVPK